MVKGFPLDKGAKGMHVRCFFMDRKWKRVSISDNSKSMVQTTVPPVHCHIGSSDVDTSGWLQTYALRLSVDVTCT